MTRTIYFDRVSVRHWLAQRRVTQRELALLLQIPETVFSLVMHGIRPLPLPLAERVAGRLGVTVDHLERGTARRRLADALREGAA